MGTTETIEEAYSKGAYVRNARFQAPGQFEGRSRNVVFGTCWPGRGLGAVVFLRFYDWFNTIVSIHQLVFQYAPNKLAPTPAHSNQRPHIRLD